MSNNTIEKMKQIIEEKKKASAEQGYSKDQKDKQKAFKTKKTGGSFNK